MNSRRKKRKYEVWTGKYISWRDAVHTREEDSENFDQILKKKKSWNFKQILKDKNNGNFDQNLKKKKTVRILIKS